MKEEESGEYWCMISLCVLILVECCMTTEISGNSGSLTGGAYDFDRATTSLSRKLLSSPKKVTIVRHGLSTWNKEGRVQVCFLNLPCLNFFL